MDHGEDGICLSDGKPEKSLFAKTAGGFFWTGLGTGGQTVIQFVVLVVLARLLTPEDFGIVAAAMVVVGLSTIFSLLGVGPAIVQRPNLETRHIRTAFTMSLFLGAFFYAVVWLTAPYVEAFFRMDGLADVLRLVALVFPIKGLGVVSESLAQRELRFKFLSGVTVASFALGYGALGIAFAALGYGPYALVWAYIGQAALMTLILLLGARHSILPWMEGKAFRELMYFGTGFTIARLGNYTALQGDNAVVGRLMDAGSLGIYGRAYQLMMLPVNLIGTVLDKVLFPAMATFQDDKERLALAFRRGIAACALLMLPVTALLIVFAAPLVELLLGGQWGAVVLPFQIMAAGLLFRTGYKISDSLARATGAVYRRAWRQWVYAGAIILFSGIGALVGLPGVAFGIAVAILINYVLMADLSHRLTGLSWPGFVGAHLAGVALGGATLSLALILKWSLAALGTEIWAMVAAIVIAPFLVLLLWAAMPRAFLGRDGQWFIRRLLPNNRFAGMLTGGCRYEC